MKRIEIIGHEGGRPPILLAFENKCGQLIGVYWRRSMKEEAMTFGSLFGKSWASQGDE